MRLLKKSMNARCPRRCVSCGSIGLIIAELLNDFAHKALFIKLVKEKDGDMLLQIAKDVSGMENVKNKGAYFMRIVYGENKNIYKNRTK